MDDQTFQLFTERLRIALENAAGVVGLVTLGTTADAAVRDQWSDHDFWVLTESGAQDAFLDDISWLPDSDNVAIALRHGKRFGTALYRDHHKVEFAVFDLDEARNGQIERYCVLIDRGNVAELAAAIHERTLAQARAGRSPVDGLKNLCVLVWTACERHSRGELLSARQYLGGFAVNQLLQLVSAHRARAWGGRVDVLDARRRLEMYDPKLAAAVLGALDEPVPDRALKLLDLVEGELKLSTPGLPWKDVATVRAWIAELDGRNGRAE